MPLGKLTVISGANAVGKSSIIQALLLLRQTSDQLRKMQGISPVNSDGDFKIPIKLNDEYGLSLGNSLAVTNANLESEVFRVTVSGLVRGIQSTVRCDFEASMTKPTLTISCNHKGANSPYLLRQEEGFSIFSREFHYLVAERVGPRDLQPMADGSFISTGFKGEFTAYAIAESETLRVSEKLPKVSGSHLFKTQLEGWMEKLVPGVQIFVQQYPEVNRVRLSISRKGSGTQQLPPANIGFGISYSLPVVVSGLLAKPGATLIVENPEAHLHPAAQSTIGYFLACVANAGAQVIIETHSENVLNGVRRAALDSLIPNEDVCLLFLSMSEKSQEPMIHKIDMNSSADLTVWPSGFFDQQSRDLTEIVKKRRALNEREPKK